MTGSAGQQRVPKEHITLTPFPLPPFAEQQRIVARVEELFVQTRALAKELAHSQIELDGLNKSTLSHLLASETPEDFNQHWDFIAEHFDLLFQTPEHVAPLRQSILELAVRGKLTRREAGDESAGELLKRFQMEKEKNGSVEKLVPIKENEKPFELPDGWEWAKLNDLVISFTNGIYKQDTFYADDGVACLRMYNISNGVLNFEKLKRITLTQEELQTYKLEKGDLLVNRVNSRELVGKTAVIGDYDEPLIYESKNIRVKLFEKDTLPYFLNYLFMLPIIKKVFTKDAKQTTGQASINQVQLKNLVVPIPPLAEQERIVKRVEQLLSLCDALEARLADAAREREGLVAAVMSTVGAP
jgi:type I restriction enzyme S subunit